MKFDVLAPFIKQAILSPNPVLQQMGLDAQTGAMNRDEDEQVVSPELESEQNKKELQPEDQIFQKAIVELYLPDPTDKSTFGKLTLANKDKREGPLNPTGMKNNPISSSGYKTATVLHKIASAFVRDIELSSLPANVQAEVAKFVPIKGAKGILFKMVVSELLPKVDPHNFKLAEEHVKGTSDRQRFFEEASKKYILMLNDKIIDGHHFLARAKALKVTNSLNVLDLTPTRFQKKSSVLNLLLQKHGHRNNSRQTVAQALLTKGVSRLHRPA